MGARLVHHGRWTESYSVLRHMISLRLVRLVDDETVEITAIGRAFIKKFVEEAA